MSKVIPLVPVGSVPAIPEDASIAGQGGELYIPINKGHFNLEPEERARAFSDKLAHGWEDEYRTYRRLWDELPRARIVRDYPLLVDLELASRCNLTCPMCPTVTEEFIEKRVKPFRKGQLDYDLAIRVIDEIGGHVCALRLSWVGEPTLHKRLVDIVRYAKQKEIREVSFLTNGWNMHLDYFKRLADAGADWITISIDGMDETYDRIRQPLKFTETLQKLRDIRAYKDAHGLTKPVIKIQGVWPAVRDNPERFYNTFAPIVDFIAYNPLIDYLHKDTDIVYEDNFVCPQHYQRLVISSNGKAAMCSNDDNVEIVVGDANTQTIHDIWHGDKLNEIRGIHAGGNFMTIGSCRRCYYPRKTVANETAVVNDRLIRVENYINRSQSVGQ